MRLELLDALGVVGHLACQASRPACEQGMSFQVGRVGRCPLLPEAPTDPPGFVRPETRASGNIESSNSRNLQIVSQPLTQRLALSVAVANMPFPVRPRTPPPNQPYASTIEPESTHRRSPPLHQTAEPQLTTAVPDCPPPRARLARVQEPSWPEVSASLRPPSTPRYPRPEHNLRRVPSWTQGQQFEQGADATQVPLSDARRRHHPQGFCQCVSSGPLVQSGQTGVSWVASRASGREGKEGGQGQRGGRAGEGQEGGEGHPRAGGQTPPDGAPKGGALGERLPLWWLPSSRNNANLPAVASGPA